MAGFISDQVLEQIRQANDIVEVIGSYFPLKRAGANFRALCPFHKEKTPSFNVNPAKQIWHCFGCGVGGDVFTFVMKYEGLDFVASARRLAERAGIQIALAERESNGGVPRDQKELLLKLHEDVAAFFHHNLMKEKSAEGARAYLKTRKISAETAKRWRLGYSPDAWDGLVKWAVARKYKPEQLEAAGLALRRDRAEEFYDRFRGRLMFPICDEQGRVVGFSGRVLTDAKDQPKYVNSPETAIFQKGKVLFALDKAKRAMLDEKYAIVCEGQVDAISCHEAGIANVVAPQGTAFTEQHARILKRYVDEVVLMFDSDTAGQNAATRSAEALFEAGLVIRVAVLPAGHDPDSFVKHFSSAALKDLVTKAPSFSVFLLERLAQQFDPRTERGKVQITQQVVSFLSHVPNAVLRAAYVQQTASMLGIPEGALLAELKKAKRGARAADAPLEPERVEADRGRGSPAEQGLLQCMLASETVVEMVAEHLDRSWLSSSVAADCVSRVLDLQAAGHWAGSSSLLNAEQNVEVAALISELVLKPLPEKQIDMAASDCLASLERSAVERRLGELRKRLSQKGMPIGELVKVQQQVLDLRRQLDNIPPLSMRKKELSRH